MCGIAGFVGDGGPDDLARMLDRLEHRGPDAGGVWFDSALGVRLGHRRLSIIDLEGGAQPMQTADGDLVVSFNGEIYNHLALRSELEALGHRFRTDHSDTEVLLHGYREWGDDLTARLDGMWAFAIVDRPRRRLLLSRDRFGEKPLFYSARPGSFVFASELGALTAHPDVDGSLSPLAVRKLFAYGYVPAPHAIVAGASKLRAGESLALDLDTLRHATERYWRFTLEPDEALVADARAEEALAEAIRERLAASVARRLMSDVPLTVFLSGGIDSSAVAAFAVEARRPDPVSSFAIGFTEASFDESDAARAAAHALGTDHSDETLSMEKALSIAPELAARLDEPIGDSSILPTFLLCRAARRIGTVALGGDGGDELFAGYDPFRALRFASAWDRVVPGPVHGAIRALAERLPTSHENISLDFKIKQTLKGLSYPAAIRNAVWMGPLEPRELDALFAEPTDVESVYAEAIEAWDACGTKDVVGRTLQFFTELYLSDGILAKVDRASMLCSLEVRAPFLDAGLVDLVRRIPHRFKLRGGETKSILRRALEPVLPASILQRPKKGFGSPIGRWLRDGRLQIDPTRAPGGLFSPGFFVSRCREHREGTHDHRIALFTHYLLERRPRADTVGARAAEEAPRREAAPMRRT